MKNARKKGIQVVGMYLANGVIEEQERELMRNIYEQEHLMIPQVKDLPMMFSAFLKKVLLKMILKVTIRLSSYVSSHLSKRCSRSLTKGSDNLPATAKVKK